MAPTATFKISRSDLANLSLPPEAFITGVKHLSSYNWIETTEPTIAVPGSPSLWSNVGLPRQLKKDSGLVYIAQNAARHPESPLEPLFRSLYIAEPSFDITAVDVVTDRNNIRKLLSFVNPRTSRNGLEDFTIKIEAVGNTAIFCRDETLTHEVIAPTEFKGYGREFEKAYTRSQIYGSTGHHRVVSYYFGNLSLIVRHETDGYVGKDSSTQSKPGDSLSQMLGSMSLSSSEAPLDWKPIGSKLTVRNEGIAVARESTLEIKTRVHHKSITIEEVVPQLWVSQTPKLVRAYHKNGKFEVPVVEDFTAAIKTWEDEKQQDLKTLAALIAKIIHMAKTHEHTTLRCNSETGTLTLMMAEGQKMLPQDLYLKWTMPKAAGPEESAAVGVDLTKSTSDPASPEISSIDSMTAIKVGVTEYHIPLAKFPHLASFVNSEKLETPLKTEFSHDPIPLFDVALSGVTSGYRQSFRLLDADIRLFESLCQTYSFLKVDVLEGQTIDDISTNLKAGKVDFEFDERSRNKPLARDSAFRLVYLMLQGDTAVSSKLGNQLFNGVFYVVSHPGTFKYKTREIVRAAYLHRFSPSAKQITRLDQWRSDKDAGESDGTTTSNEDYRFHSDDGWFGSDSS